MSARPLNAFDGPLVWIDCEMTGLDPRTDKILEIAVIITNGNLEPVHKGVQYVIRTDQAVLDAMGEWCTKQHGRSGLTRACLASLHSHDSVYKLVLAYIKRWIPQPRIACLAGNSIHADRAFLVESMPEVVDWLHYRVVDVSSIKELSRRWFTRRVGIPTLPDSNHRALDDIRGSINELQWYRKNIFVQNFPPSSPESSGLQ